MIPVRWLPVLDLFTRGARFEGLARLLSLETSPPRYGAPHEVMYLEWRTSREWLSWLASTRDEYSPYTRVVSTNQERGNPT